MKKRVLFVSNRSAVLYRFEEMLRTESERWDGDFLGCGNAALDSIESQGCDVVIASAEAASMSGAELLAAVSERYPETVRVILTDPEDFDPTIGMIGSAHQFLSESCERAGLAEALHRAERAQEMLEDRGLKTLMGKIGTLPSLPALYAQIVRELQSAEPSITRVARTIADDVSMAAKTLQLVNSVAFAPRVRITDPIRAAIYLGVDVLKAFVLSANVFSQFDRIQVAELTLGELWDHSVYVATLSQKIVRTLEPAEAESAFGGAADDAFMAGVLHDIGKLILAANLPDSYIKAVEIARANDIPLVEAERVFFGATHAEIGAFLMALWGLSDDIVQSIRYHHRPSEGGSREFDALTAVHIANGLAAERRDSQDGESLERHFDLKYLEEVGVLDRLPEWRELC